MRPWVLWIAALCGAGCATPQRIWIPTDASYAPAGGRYSVDLPAGWMRFGMSKTPDGLLLTRDGMPLEVIAVGVVDPGKPFPIGASKLPMRAEMTPQEAAEVVVDGIESGSGFSGVQVLENAPIDLAGRKGFRVVASYKHSDGLSAGIAVCGVVTPRATYYLMFQAPRRVYFPRHLPEFDRMVASFQLRGPDAAKPEAAAPVPSS